MISQKAFAAALVLTASVFAPTLQADDGLAQTLDSINGAARSLSSAKPPVPAPAITVSEVAKAKDPDAAQEISTPTVPVEWVPINGGKFTMGTDAVDTVQDPLGFGDSSDLFGDAKPAHEVAVKTFEMSKTLVTVEQYAECVSKGGCAALSADPDPHSFCNWGKAGRQRHPINCVDWDEANQYAKFKDARLPSESEWEYAERSEGKNQKYPWGNADPTCDTAVMYTGGASGCGSNGTMPVCSKPAGNTAQGLCDMTGNLFGWVQDAYQSSYAGEPTDGNAFEGVGSSRVLRGSAFNSYGEYMRVEVRHSDNPIVHNPFYGFRLARSSR